MTIKVDTVRPEAAGAVLSPYLPRLVIDWLAAEPETTWREIDGSIAFVDISGFTRLSERLARQGKVGGEELADTISACFASLLAVAYAQGGGLLKFGGDALLLLFTGPGHEHRACTAAVEMRRALRTVGRLEVSGQRVNLRMSVGVHSGAFHFFLVGESHRELIITGPGASTTVMMEGTAEAGEILVSPSTAAALRPGLLGDVKGPGVLLRRAPTGSAVDLTERVDVPAELDLELGVPVAVRQALLAGVRDAEHRRVTVAFVHFDGTDDVITHHGGADAAARLHALVSTAQRAAEEHGITFLATDADRDGGKIILTAGAPIAFGDDERRMLLALRRIIDTDVGLPVRVGVNRGDVFAGDIGPSYRRTYTVMGDTVNLAARLMAKAPPGEILATQGLLERSPTRFVTDALEPFMVKGKAKPVQAFRVGPVAGSKLSAAAEERLPLIGRDSELAALLAAVDAACGGRGALAEVVGEPGLGKSRLIEELRHRASDVRQLVSSCETYESSTPYYPFRGLVRGLLGLGVHSGGEAASLISDAIAATAPELAPWAPLVAAVVDVDMADTPETASLEEQFRRGRLGEVMRSLLGHLLADPTLLLFEDVHWMDEASADLLRDLGDAVGALPWVICTTRRDVEGGFVAAPGSALALRLTPLSADAAAALAAAATAVAPISPHQLALLTERAGGNPLFLKELLASLDAADGLDTLPDSVEALITARIDRLAPGDRNLLRRLGVLGRRFAADLLPAVLDEVPRGGDPVWDRLSGFIRAGDDGALTFDHALVRDAAYEGLPFRLRRELHARAGDAIERAAGPHPDEQAELLSLHYLHAQRHSDAWKYALVAAERARAIYANVEAAEFYERALEAARRLRDVAVSTVADAYEALGDVHVRVGNYVSAEAAYGAARRLRGGEAIIEARLHLKLAWVHGWRNGYPRALRWITKGLRRLDGVAGIDAARQRGELMAWYGQFCIQEGRPRAAMQWCTLASQTADAAGDRATLALALKILDWAATDLGVLESPDNLVRALGLYEDLGDLPGQTSVLNSLGVIAHLHCDWTAALDYYGRARDMVKRTGDITMESVCTNNIGEILLDQGHVELAAEHFVEAVRLSRAAGLRQGAVLATRNMGRVALRRGDTDQAIQLLEETLQQAREMGAHAEMLETRARLSECLLVTGDIDAAKARAEESLAVGRTLDGGGAHAPLLHRVVALALKQQGDLDGATSALREALAAGRARQAQYEVALALEISASVAEAAGDPGPQLRAESRAILERLGVVALPDLVGAG